MFKIISLSLRYFFKIMVFIPFCILSPLFLIVSIAQSNNLKEAIEITIGMVCMPLKTDF